MLVAIFFHFVKQTAILDDSGDILTVFHEPVSTLCTTGHFRSGILTECRRRNSWRWLRAPCVLYWTLRQLFTFRSCRNRIQAIQCLPADLFARPNVTRLADRGSKAVPGIMSPYSLKQADNYRYSAQLYASVQRRAGVTLFGLALRSKRVRCPLDVSGSTCTQATRRGL